MKKTKKFGMGGDMPAPTTQDLSKMLRAYEEAGAGKPAQPNATMPNPMAGVKKPYPASPVQQEQDMRNAVKQAEANVDKSMSPTPKPGKPVSTQPVRDVPKTGLPRFVLPPTLSRPVIPPRPRIPPPRPTTPVPPRPATPVDPIPPRRIIRDPVPPLPVSPRPPTPTPETPRPPTPTPPPTPVPQPKQDVGIGKFMQDQVNKPRAMLKTGGAVKASKRGDGIAQRGKTKGRMV